MKIFCGLPVACHFYGKAPPLIFWLFGRRSRLNCDERLPEACENFVSLSVILVFQNIKNLVIVRVSCEAASHELRYSQGTDWFLEG